MDDFNAFDTPDDGSLIIRIEDRWFDPWSYAKGDGLRALVDRSKRGIIAHEKITGARERNRRPSDAETHEAVVEAIVTNLARACVDPPPEGARIAIPLRKANHRNRYENPGLSTRTIRDVIKKMEEFDALSLRIGAYRRGTTTIFPTEWFGSQVQQCGVTLDDFGRRESEEVIILKRKAKDEHEGWTRDDESRWVDYFDTDITEALRAEVRAFNQFLEGAELEFLDDGQEPKVNTSDRRLKRYFTVFKDGGEIFDRSGRLFGGWWEHLKKECRRNVRVQGDPVAILDYASMFGRLAYAHLGLQAPEGDLYDLTGLLAGYDTTIKNHRRGVKKVFNALIFGGGMGTRMPEGARALLPPKVSVAEVREAIRARHPELEALFGTQVGFKLMFQESQVLLRTLAMLMEKFIVALPLHDGLLVAQSFADRS